MSTDHFNLTEFLKSARGMVDKAREKLNKLTVVGESGAGWVCITMNAKHEAIECALSDELMRESKEVIQDLICAAISDASQKINKATQDSVLSFDPSSGASDGTS